jgi:hypothetical protein
MSEVEISESLLAAESEIRDLLTAQLLEELNKQIHPDSILRPTSFIERLAVWVVARRSFNADIYIYMRSKRKRGLELVPRLRKGAVQLKKVLEEARAGRLLRGADEMLEELSDWIDEINRLDSDLKAVPTSRGATGRPQDRDLVFVAAELWRDNTGEPPPIDRDGRFYRFLQTVVNALPPDCRPQAFPAETIKDWITQYRRPPRRGGE